MLLPVSTPAIYRSKGQRTLPLELWAHIFQDATAVTNFFDTCWDALGGNIITAFDEASPSCTSAYESFANSLRELFP